MYVLRILIIWFSSLDVHTNLANPNMCTTYLIFIMLLETSNSLGRENGIKTSNSQSGNLSSALFSAATITPNFVRNVLCIYYPYSN